MHPVALFLKREGEKKRIQKMLVESSGIKTREGLGDWLLGERENLF
jgi:hypothetical protein